MRHVLLLMWPLLIVLAACTEESSSQQTANTGPRQSQAEIDETRIQGWLADQGLVAQSTSSGIYYILEAAGSEEKPNLSSVVTVHYRGTNLDGVEFDASRGEPVTFPLARLIKGWQEGIPLVGRGGKVKLIIPSGLAYGPQALSAEVGPNSVLVFDIELVDFR